MPESPDLIEAAAEYAVTAIRTVYDAAAWRYLNLTDPDLLNDLMEAVDRIRKVRVG